MSRDSEMTAYIFIITFCVTAKVHSSYDFKVYQPQNRTVNPDGSAIITCEHDANVSSILDVRLNAIPLYVSRGLHCSSDKLKNILCQKGLKTCKNITMLLENPNKCIFIMLNVGAEAMNMQYECEFTVKNRNIDYCRKGSPTRLLAGNEGVYHLEPPSLHPLHPPTSQCPQLITWILVGLLTLTIMYSCVISTFCIIQRRRTAEPENSTYVEMRKAPLPRYPAADIYCG